MKYLLYFGFCFIFLFACFNEKNKTTKQPKKTSNKKTLSESEIKTLFNTCTPCHGERAEGKKEMNAPALVNQESWYLENQFWAFKKGFRGTHANDVYGAQMAAIANTINDENAVSEIMRYIKSFPAVVTPRTVEGDVNKGQSHYNMICGACHGAGAKGNKDLNAPKLTGIDDWYLERQLLNYRNDIRGSHPDDALGLQMQSMAKTIKDEQTVKDIVAYIQSLQEQAL